MNEAFRELVYDAHLVTYRLAKAYLNAHSYKNENEAEAVCDVFNLVASDLGVSEWWRVELQAGHYQVVRCAQRDAKPFPTVA